MHLFLIKLFSGFYKMLMLFGNRVCIRAHYSEVVYKHQKLWINLKSSPYLIEQIKFGRVGEQANS